MRRIIRIFLSIRTAVILLLFFMLLAFIGSLSLITNLAFFSGIDESPLFSWLSASANLKATWWIYLMILALCLLAVNTIFCTIDALMKRAGWKGFMLKLSPEVMHVGVLFIMLGHLLTASIGFKSDLAISKGESTAIGNAAVLTVKDVRFRADAGGYAFDYEADILWAEAGKKSIEHMLRPVHPLYFGKYGIYIKSVTLEPEPSAQLRICRDPGALWAGIGGLLLAAGGICFLYAKPRSS